MNLRKALMRWPLVPLTELKSAVESKLEELRGEGPIEAARG